MFGSFPAAAAWQHLSARTGFEAAYFTPTPDGWRIEGSTTAIEAGVIWTVGYDITVDATWCTRTAVVRGRSGAASITRSLVADGMGHWLVDGRATPELDGCLDVDLESSAMTNTLPVHRRPDAKSAEAPAAYVRADGLEVERLEQRYRQLSARRYAYEAPAFDFACELTYDDTGLVLDYPGIARRAD